MLSLHNAISCYLFNKLLYTIGVACLNNSLIFPSNVMPLQPFLFLFFTFVILISFSRVHGKVDIIANVWSSSSNCCCSLGIRLVRDLDGILMKV